MKNRTEYFKKYHSDNAERESKQHKDWYLKNKDHRKQYLLKNKDLIREKHKIYMKRREREDPSFLIANRLRSRLNKAIQGKKAGSAVKDLGCSIQHLKLHLELFWDKGMNWDNYGNKEGQWSLDHAVPLSNFNLTNRQQFLEANHFSNLQPMWHTENIIKSNNDNPGARASCN